MKIAIASLGLVSCALAGSAGANYAANKDKLDLYLPEGRTHATSQQAL